MKSILVFRSAALGDFIMSTPAFAELRRAFPEYRVVFLTIQTADKTLMGKVSQYTGGSHSIPWVDLTMPHLIDEVIALKSVTDLRYLWSLRRCLRKYRFEKAIVMNDVWGPLKGRLKKRLLLYFLIGPVPVFGCWGPSDPFELKRKGLLKHHVHGPLQFLSEMTPPRKYNDEDLIFDLRPSESANKWALSWLSDHFIDYEKRLVAFAPGSIQPHKRWPIESFQNLIVLILNRYDNLDILIVGTPADKMLGDTLVLINPQRIRNLAGVTTITQSAALLAHCSLLVGNDGGAMHLGDAVGCKVVSIVPGIEYPDSIEPWNNKELAIRWPVECSPCYSFTVCPKGHNKCMKELPVSLVFDKCTSIL